MINSVIKTHLKGYVGRRWHQLMTSPPLYYRLFYPSQLPDFVSFGKAFPDVDKLHHRPARSVPTPEAADLLGSDDVTHLDRSYYTIPEDYTSILRNTLVCPENQVVLTDDRKIIRESSTAKKLKYINTRVFYTARERFIEGHAFLFRSRFHNYYHLLIDALPRLLALARSPFDQIKSIKLLCPGGITDTEEFFLSKLGLKNVHVFPLEAKNTLCRVEHLIFTPLKTEIGAGYLPSFYRKELQERIDPKHSSSFSRRIFISRVKARRRRLANHDALVDALSGLGFDEHVVEDLSHQEQIEFFNGADVVVGAHGAGLTNVLFSKETKVVELFPYSWMLYLHYFYLCKSLGHPYRWVWGETEEDSYPHPEYFRVDVDEVLDALRTLGVE